jgi:serine/threonine protein kinase
MAEPRSFGAVLNMLDELARLLDTLHSKGRVHRDLKPGNVLLLVHSHVWRLIDFGVTARTGASPAPLYPSHLSHFRNCTRATVCAQRRTPAH